MPNVDVPSIEPINQNSLLLRFADHPNEELIDRISALWQQLSTQFDRSIKDAVAANTTLMLVLYEECELSDFVPQLQHYLAESALSNTADRTVSPRQHLIPVCYHPSLAADLEAAAMRIGLATEQLIALHSEKTYRIFAVGFLPGFAYIGQLEAKLSLPRLATPRTEVLAGSVGIAEHFTGIYPRRSPGGWNVIGRTPLCTQPNLTDLSASESADFRVGDEVRFRAISLEEFTRQNQHHD